MAKKKIEPIESCRSQAQLGDFLELCDMTGLKVSLQWKDDYL